MRESPPCALRFGSATVLSFVALLGVSFACAGRGPTRNGVRVRVDGADKAGPSETPTEPKSSVQTDRSLGDGSDTSVASGGLQPPRFDAAAQAWRLPLGSASVWCQAPQEHERAVQGIYAALRAIEEQGAVLVPDIRLAWGWTEFRLGSLETPAGTAAAGGPELWLTAPDYERLPELRWEPDLRYSLDLWEAQQVLLDELGIEEETLRYDEEVLVVEGILDKGAAYMLRVPSPGGRLSGWRLVPDAGPGDAPIDYLPVHRVAAARPELAAALRLPAGYMALSDGTELSAVVDEQDRQVWPVAAAPGGTMPP